MIASTISESEKNMQYQVPTAPLNPLPTPHPKRKRRPIVLIIALGSIILVIILAFVGYRTTLQNFRVTGSAMEPALHDGQTIEVNKLAYLFGGHPQRNDIVVFHEVDPGNDICSLALPLPQTLIVKRIVGLPGDTIINTATSLSVNGNVLYTTSAGRNFVPFNLKLDANHYFALGDNPAVSLDSRCLGPIALNTIIGPVV